MGLNQRGQAMLELLLIVPVFLILLLSLVQLTELLAAHMGTEWSARHAARSAAVHIEDAEDISFRVALQSLAPFLAPVPLAAMPAAGKEELSDPRIRWPARALFYQQSKRHIGDNAGIEGVAALFKFDPEPVQTSVRIRLADDEGRLQTWEGSDDLSENLRQAGGIGDVTITVDFRYPLRIPLVGRLFADGEATTVSRRIRRQASFPVMYAP